MCQRGKPGASANPKGTEDVGATLWSPFRRSQKGKHKGRPCGPSIHSESMMRSTGRIWRLGPFTRRTTITAWIADIFLSKINYMACQFQHANVLEAARKEGVRQLPRGISALQASEGKSAGAYKLTYIIPDLTNSTT
jgi:hypothetical protein